MTIREEIESHLVPLFQKMGVDPVLGKIAISDRPDLADYQCNGAMGAARILGKSPRTIAEEIMARFQIPGMDISIAGPGFLNFRCHSDFLAQRAAEQLPMPNHGIAPAPLSLNIILDYGGLNVAKPMHVGHLRSCIIGECLKRLLRLKGHNVLADIHLGDWGTQMGLLIHGLQEKHPDWVYFDAQYKEAYPKDSPVSLEDLDQLYPVMSAAAKDNEDIAKAARKAVQELQSGRRGYRALWQHFVNISVQDIKQQLDCLGVHFDQWFGESRYQDALAPMVEDLLAKGVAQHSKGAVVIRVQVATDKNEIPPLLLQKSDGGYLYGTTDIATLQERMEKFKADLVIYVVDQRQALHFEQVFRGAKQAGFTPETVFVGFGTMNGSDNKPFKTRSGGVMRLQELTDLLQEEATKRMIEGGLDAHLSPQEQERTALQIGLAALKFADLQHDPKQNYQFSIEKFMRFEGKTGPYLQYASVRIQAMMDKARVEEIAAAPILADDLSSEERELLLHLVRTSEYIDQAVATLAPHIICDAAFTLAQSFSRFYQNCPLLQEKNKDKQGSRLSLVQLTYQTLSLYLGLLGIEIPKKM